MAAFLLQLLLEHLLIENEPCSDLPGKPSSNVKAVRSNYRDRAMGSSTFPQPKFKTHLHIPISTRTHNSHQGDPLPASSAPFPPFPTPRYIWHRSPLHDRYSHSRFRRMAPLSSAYRKFEIRPVLWCTASHICCS